MRWYPGSTGCSIMADSTEPVSLITTSRMPFLGAVNRPGYPGRLCRTAMGSATPGSSFVYTAAAFAVARAVEGGVLARPLLALAVDGGVDGGTVGAAAAEAGAAAAGGTARG